MSQLLVQVFHHVLPESQGASSLMEEARALVESDGGGLSSAAV